jgi:cell division protease FtsH
MASLPGPLSLPEPKAKKQKKKIDIPYNRWPNRIRRAIKSFIKIFILISLAITIYMLATIDDVSLGIFFALLAQLVQLFLFVVTAMFGIVVQFGLLFWFLSRPQVEVIRPGDDTTVTFDDYWGQPQLVKLVKQWMSLLRDRKEFEKMGGKYISGLLLYGPPGTGKTMLAKAIAGESGMAFLSSAGTGFQGMFWGMDILKVLRFSRMARQLAKKYGACVAYIDEIDAVGMNRGGVRGGGMGGMVTGTGMGMGLGMFALSTLLSQMDGMNSPSRTDKLKTKIWRKFGRKYVAKRNWHVMWMGSTNRPDVLDPALTRSGRLDTKIAVEAPDRASRRLIIEGYLQKVQHDETVDVEAIVADTNGLTPADIMGAVTKDAVRIAFFDGRKKVSQKDIDKAFLEQQAGMEMPIEEFDEGQKRILAYHEAGHAIAQYYMMPEQKIVRATIVRLSTGSYGHVSMTDTVEQHIRPVNRLAYDIIVAMAGRESEKIYTGEMFQSVGGDFPAIRSMMYFLVENGFFGPPIAGGPNGPMGPSYDQFAHDKDQTLKKYWLVMEEATNKLLRKHWKEVTALAEELLIKNTLSGKEVIDIIEANQTADSLDENIIPKTLAAMRAHALAEIRNGKSGGALLNEPVPAVSNGVIIEEPVVIINGNSNGSGAGAYHPVPVNEGAPEGDNKSSSSSSSGEDSNEPQVISGGMGDYQPEVINQNEQKNPPEEQK